MNNSNKKIENKSNIICLIDNYPLGSFSDRISRFKTILQNSIAPIETKIIHFTDLNEEIIKKSIGIILSGSSFNVSEFCYDDKIRRKFELEIKIIKNAMRKPILGICFGHHLIAYAYGAQVCRMGLVDMGDNIIFILLKKTDELITKDNIPVNVHHLDFVSLNDSKIQEQFEIISVSRTKNYGIIQYMKHLNKPIYSIQFHPETHQIYSSHSTHFDDKIINKAREVGGQIIENFIWHCIYNK